MKKYWLGCLQTTCDLESIKYIQIENIKELMGRSAKVNHVGMVIYLFSCIATLLDPLLFHLRDGSVNTQFRVYQMVGVGSRDSVK